MRLFIAIEFPAAVRSDISLWAQSIAAAIADPDRRLHWVKEEQLHLTLKFLGEIPEDRRPRLEQALRIAVVHHSPFSLSLSKIGHFGGRVVWLGLEQGIDPLSRLAQSLEEACETAGFARENRHFQPHITLARSKVNPRTIRLADLPTDLARKEFDPFVVDQVSLVRSTLTPRGAVYETLERVPLRNVPMVG